jgi:hypothetical protein
MLKGTPGAGLKKSSFATGAIGGGGGASVVVVVDVLVVEVEDVVVEEVVGDPGSVVLVDGVVVDVAGADVVAGLVAGDVAGAAVVVGGHDVAAEVCPAPASTATPTTRATTTGSTPWRRQRTATTSNAPTAINTAATRTSDVVDAPVTGSVEHSFIAAPPVCYPPSPRA